MANPIYGGEFLMHLVLLSGGSGKRLWPLSNDARSKQFLKVLKDEDGKPQSMVQRVWKQLASVGLSDKVVIATGRAQVDMINSQLGTGPKIILEPERRDTYPAIALATSFIKTVQGAAPNDVITVLPVDPYVETSFFSRIKILEEALKKSAADIALIGVVPSFPSTKYGYIIPENHMEIDRNDFMRVSSFKEKPEEEIARELMSKGALWNCGIFAFRVKFLLKHLEEKGFSTQYDELLEQYSELPKISFDYEIVEKTNKIVVIDYNGDWKDLGTWNTLTDEMKNPIKGKGILSKDCINCHLINELEIPVAVLGCQNIIVAASPDGILVTQRDASPRVKELVGKFDGRPMYEERRWGWYRVLDHTTFPDGHEVLTKRIAVKAGKNLSYQYHLHRSEIWTVISGTGMFAIDGRILPVKAGDVLEIPVGRRHGIKANNDLEFIEVQTGSQLIEEDIKRVCMSWEEIEGLCQKGENYDTI